ncbi:MAG: DUF1778 domain-containing protein [Alphaproteobacteria bacterium]|nr:DUF1778 domain-containing protein [Alphaproteobacteria bacterium]
MIQVQDYTASVRETKTHRKELKMKPSVAEAIKNASLAVGMDMSTFISSAAYKAAREVEFSQHQTVLSADAFDAFAAANDAQGTRNPTLGTLLQRRNDLFQDG